METTVHVSIPWLNRVIPLEVPEGSVIVEPNEASCASDPAALVRAAVDSPLESPPFGEFLSGGVRVLVIVNDATRPTPTATMLDAIADALGAARSVQFIVATGAHRAPTEGEYRTILGRHHGRFRRCIMAHDARDESSLADLGSTRNGTPILLNRAVLVADRIVVMGSVEPHYFAGYSGGRKAFLPGVAGFRTIEANHRLALDPRACSLELDDNPVSQDMDDALALVPGSIFTIMAVLDRHQGLSSCTAGSVHSAFRRAVDEANAVFAVRMARRADLVVTVARHPMDIDLYQSQKAIDNGALAASDGGTLILVSPCRDGVGDRAYLDLLGSSANPEEALENIAREYRLGYHKAARIAQAAMRIRLEAFSELDAATLKKAFMEKVSSLQEAVTAALARLGPGARVAVFLDGTVTVPIIDPVDGAAVTAASGTREASPEGIEKKATSCVGKSIGGPGKAM